MAKLSLTCECGWKFFIPGSTQGHEVTCPNCGNGVRIPGRKPGEGVVSAGMLAAQKQARAGRIRLLIGLSVGVVIAGIVLVVVMGGKGNSEPPAEPERTTSRSPFPALNTRTDSTNAPAKKEPDRPARSDEPARPVVDSARIGRLKQTATDSEHLINIAGIVTEVLWLKGAQSEAQRVTAQMAQLSTRIQESMAEIAAAGEKHKVEPHMEPGDRILSFSQRDLTAMRPSEAAALLEGWLLRLKGTALEPCLLWRNSSQISIFIFIPEETKEILQLTRLPATATVDGPVSLPSGVVARPGPSGTPTIVDVAPALAKDIRARLQALPPAYLPLLPAEDLKRMEAILKEMKGPPEDVAFLNNRILDELIIRLEQEASLFRSKIQELEPKTRESTSVDTVVFKDGRKVEGKVEEETPEYVKIKSRFGSVKVPRADIAKLERGKGAGAQFPDKLKAAKGSVSDLVALLSWCKENNLRVEKEYVCYLILTQEPLNDKARTEVGLGRPLTGAPPKPPSPAADPGVAARNEAVAQTITGIAADVARSYPILTDVLNSMRTQSDPFRYTVPVTPPEKSAVGARLINNPLTFTMTDLSGPSAVELGSWWGGLSPDDRKEFARFFGLWCAYQRFLAPQKK